MSDGFSDAVRNAIQTLGYSDHVILVERPSSSGKYVSITFRLQVRDGKSLDSIYRQLEQLPGLAYLL